MWWLIAVLVVTGSNPRSLIHCKKLCGQSRVTVNTVKYCSEGNLHALGLQKYLRVERETSNSIRTAAEKCRIILNGNQGIGRFCDHKTNYCILFGKNRVSKHVFADK